MAMNKSEVVRLAKLEERVDNLARLMEQHTERSNASVEKLSEIVSDLNVLANKTHADLQTALVVHKRMTAFVSGGISAVISVLAILVPIFASK